MRRRLLSPRRVATATLALALPAAAAAQATLPINVPLKCEDGITRTITRCATNARGGEVCAWREEKNGQLIVERFNVRGQMDGWLMMCQVPPATAAPAASTAPPVPAARPAAAPPPVTGPAAVPLNPPYLAGFPEVSTVRREIAGTDPADGLARQIATLNYLPRLITRMQMAPGRPANSTTPDEQRLMATYAAASAQLSQLYAKTATPAQVTAFQQAVGRYELDQAQSDKMFALLAPATQAEFRRINGGASAQAQARVDSTRRENEPARAQPSTGNTSATPLRNDPGTVAARRCLELGGGTFECMGKGLTTGMLDLAGLGGVATALTAARPGVRMGGTYKSAGSLSLIFGEESVEIAGCGQLVQDGHSYTVTRRGTLLDVAIDNEATPITVTLGADGRLTGPATADVHGRIITGYEVYWVEKRNVSDNSVVPGSGHEERRPIYAPKTERCAFAGFRATAPVLSDTSLIGAIVGIAGGQADPAAQRSGTTEAPAGPRMAGSFAGGGLQLEFHPTAVVIDCGDAHVLRPYAVENLADRLRITLRNGDVPVALTVQGNGTLAGMGTIDVAGRVVTAVNDSGPVFAPKSARCPVGALTPQ